MKDLIGRKVIMKPGYAKWLIMHPEVYVSGSGKVDASYDSETQLHLVCLLGEEVPGHIEHVGNDCYYVYYFLDGLTAKYYVERKNFILLQPLQLFVRIYRQMQLGQIQ